VVPRPSGRRFARAVAARASLARCERNVAALPRMVARGVARCERGLGRERNGKAPVAASVPAAILSARSIDRRRVVHLGDGGLLVEVGAQAGVEHRLEAGSFSFPASIDEFPRVDPARAGGPAERLARERAVATLPPPLGIARERALSLREGGVRGERDRRRAPAAVVLPPRNVDGSRTVCPPDRGPTVEVLVKAEGGAEHPLEVGSDLGRRLRRAQRGVDCDRVVDPSSREGDPAAGDGPLRAADRARPARSSVGFEHDSIGRPKGADERPIEEGAPSVVEGDVGRGPSLRRPPQGARAGRRGEGEVVGPIQRAIEGLVESAIEGAIQRAIHDPIPLFVPLVRRSSIPAPALAAPHA
ncbi:hypothetical protein ACHAWF_001445, partial [Thalassiosira exigua]